MTAKKEEGNADVITTFENYLNLLKLIIPQEVQQRNREVRKYIFRMGVQLKKLRELENSKEKPSKPSGINRFSFMGGKS